MVTHTWCGWSCAGHAQVDVKTVGGYLFSRTIRAALSQYKYFSTGTVFRAGRFMKSVLFSFMLKYDGVSAGHLCECTFHLFVDQR